MVRSVSRECVGIRSRIRRGLVSVSRSRTVRDRDEGELDGDKISAIATGRIPDGPFTQRTLPQRSVNTAVMLLGDGSASMRHPTKGGPSYSRAKVQAGVSLGMLQALRSVRVPAAYALFGEEWRMVAGFRDPVPSVDRMARITILYGAHGGTDLASAMTHSADYVLKREERRLILITVTDGDVNMGHQEVCRRVVDAARQAGVECYGVGIGPEASMGLRAIMGRARVVCSVDGADLRSTMGELARSLLINGPAR